MKSQIIWWFLIGVIAIGVGFYIYKDISSKPQQDIVQELSLNNLDKEEDYKVEIIPIENESSANIPIPDLDKPIIFGDNVSEEVRKTTTEKINILIEELKKDNNLFSNWIELGLYRKLIEDYEGAEEVWKYASIVWPKNTISFSNLGDLYHYYLKDFPKAEQNLRVAIENDKNNAQAYIALHELYKYSYKQDTALAESVLLEGILSSLSRTVLDIDLVITLAAYYKERGDTAKGDIANAKKYYTQARDQAQTLGNTNLVTLLNTELSKLE
jgi:tetratricopeptide (TPR) repeat protein